MLTYHQAAHVIDLARFSVEDHPSETAQTLLDEACASLAAKTGNSYRHAAGLALKAIEKSAGLQSQAHKSAAGYIQLCY